MAERRRESAVAQPAAVQPGSEATAIESAAPSESAAPGSSAANPLPRPAVRLLVLDEADRLLMVHYRDDERVQAWWGTPGGGLGDGESHEEAAQRELREETGLDVVAIGPWVWSREHVFPMYGRWFRQQERFYVVRVRAFDPVAAGLVEGEAQYFRGLRWWTLAEMDATAEELSPRRLSELLRRLLSEGPPREPIDVGV